MYGRPYDEHEAGRGSPLREQLGLLMRDLRASVHARVDVAKLEMRSSSRHLLGGAIALVGGLLFAIGAWLTACALLVAALAAFGLSWLVAMLLVVVVNGLLTGIAMAQARKHLRQVSMTHTWHAFLGHPEVDSGAPPVHAVRTPEALREHERSAASAVVPPLRGTEHGVS